MIPFFYFRVALLLRTYLTIINTFVVDAFKIKSWINVTFAIFTNIFRVGLDLNIIIEILYKSKLSKLLLSWFKSYGPASHFWNPKRRPSFPISFGTIYQ